MSKAIVGKAVAGLEQALMSRPLSLSASRTSDLSSWADVVDVLKLNSWFQSGEEHGKLYESLLSRLLTYPLTVGRYLKYVQDDTRPKECNIAIVGARAESNLPALYWSQLGRFSGAERWNIKFVGPHILGVPQWNPALPHREDGRMKYSSSAEYFDKNDEEDFLVLFNSGIGHSKEGAHWKKALKGIEGTKAILTSFNDKDLANDLHVLSQYQHVSVDLTETNPLASRWEERSSSGERVFCNHSVMVATFGDYS